ncbi:MAG: hypothetical protein HOJ15_00785 [Candidatus Jacksonbacteria bacterium]|jgi:hypothetical protein|nr:hypothetical protein [Candidatus Jacksonbacteria bacterium]MBT6300948.1 hypothetical protein [Candidatus Jacksonbacteria bacterium]MBT6954754.1 hypothetical protein [Candidatus Jacksonbacteria bacterium]
MRRHALIPAVSLAAMLSIAFGSEARYPGLLLGGTFGTVHSSVNGVEHLSLAGEVGVDNWYNANVRGGLLQDVTDGRVKPAYGFGLGLDTLQDTDYDARALQLETDVDVLTSPGMLTRVLGDASVRFQISGSGRVGGYVSGSYASTWYDDVVVYGDLRQDSSTAGLGVSFVTESVDTRFNIGPAFVYSNVRDDAGISRARERGGVIAAEFTHISNGSPLWVSVDAHAGVVQNDSGVDHVSNQGVGGLNLTISYRKE